GLPLRASSGIGVQLERRAKGHTTVGGADVIDIARVARRAVLGIDQVNYVVKSGRLTPAFVTPVTTAIRKHDREVTDRANARTGEAGTRIGISPGVTAVGGPKDEVDVVVRKTSAAFIHAGDVHVACREVAGNLDISDERGGDLALIRPSETVVSRI